MDDKPHTQLIEDIKLFRGVAMILAGMIMLSTVLFHFIEKWGWLDSLYFTIVTVATVGYGDLSPQSSAGKVIAILLIVFGISLLAISPSCF